jgi:hypothetical protein
MLLLSVLSSVNSMVENPAFWKHLCTICRDTYFAASAPDYSIKDRKTWQVGWHKMWFPCWLTKITWGASSSSTLYTL